MRSILQIAAWLSLVGGIVAGLVSFAATSQLGALAFGFGIGYIFSGFVIWALLLVIVQIAERLEQVESGTNLLLQRSEPLKKEVRSYSVLDRI